MGAGCNPLRRLVPIFQPPVVLGRIFEKFQFARIERADLFHWTTDV